MLDGSFFPDECFVKGLEYWEDDGVYAKYGKCIGFHECVKRDPIAAIQCYLHSDDLSSYDRFHFMAEDFLHKALNDELENMYPYRLCTNVEGGRCTVMHVIREYL